MIFSDKHKFIYIASPKTGTVSVHRFLEENFSDLNRWGVTKDGKSIKVRGHATALEIRNSLGTEYKYYKSFTFVRNPYSKIVSSYFFLRKGGKKDFSKPKATNPFIELGHKVKYLLARILPFPIWSIVYPYKSNLEYVMDEKGKIIVTYIGRFENLEEDLYIILDKIGLKYDKSALQVLNKSNHEDYKSYFSNGLHKRLIDFKIRKELKFYNKILNAPLE